MIYQVKENWDVHNSVVAECNWVMDPALYAVSAITVSSRSNSQHNLQFTFNSAQDALNGSNCAVVRPGGSITLTVGNAGTLWALCQVGGVAYVDITLTYEEIVATGPTIQSFVAEQVVLDINDPTYNWGIYVARHSAVQLTCTAVAGAAAITSYAFTGAFPDEDYPNIAYAFPVVSSGTVTFSVTVTDASGQTATATTTILVEPYRAPIFTSTEVYRFDENGNRDPTGENLSIYAQVQHSPLSGYNAVQTLNAFYSSDGGSTWLGPVSLTSGVVDTSVDDLDPTLAYIVRIVAIDYLETTEYNTALNSGRLILHIKDGGTGVAVGCASVNDGFEVAEDWEARFYGATLINLLVPVGIYITLDDTYDPTDLYPNTTWSLASQSGTAKTWIRTA